MDENEPRIRAYQIQNRLNHLKSICDKKTAERIVSRIPETTLRAIRKASRNQWLPVVLNVEITDIIAEELGEEAVYNLSNISFLRIVQTSFASPFFRSALNLLKIEPTAVLKLCPVFWKSIYRNCGEMYVIQVGPTSLQFLIERLPHSIANSRAYLYGIAGGIHSVYTLCDITGEVVLEERSEISRNVSFLATWTSNVAIGSKS